MRREGGVGALRRRPHPEGKGWVCLLLGLALTVLMAWASADAGERQPAKPGERDKCPVCGMFVAKYPNWLAQIEFQDGTRVFFDGVKDLMKFYFDLPRFAPGKKPDEIAAIWVTDYYRLTPVDARQAFYVHGSEVYGPMGKELIPFLEEAAAREFLRDHRGKAVLTFPHITPAVLNTLD